MFDQAAADIVNDTVTARVGFARMPFDLCAGVAIVGSDGSMLVNNLVAFNSLGVLGWKGTMRNDLVCENPALTAVTMGDVALALRVAGGLARLTPEARATLDVAGGGSEGRVDLADALVLIRALSAE